MTKAVFFGTPEAATPALETLNRIADVVGVVTQPDRAQGRSGHPVPAPVKRVAESLRLPVVQPAKMSEAMEVANAADIGVLVAFGRIVPPALLAAPRLGIINIHFSVLPRWRGAGPVHRAILDGDPRTGVSLMQMDEGLDTGPVLASCQTLVGDANVGSLTARLALLGADLLAATWWDLIAGAIAPVLQDEAEATSAPKVIPADLRISPQSDAAAVLRQVRAFAPRPGAWGIVDGDRFKILEGRVLKGALEPGVIDAVDGRPALGTAAGAVELITVQPAGKPPMNGVDWFNGRRREPQRFS